MNLRKMKKLLTLLLLASTLFSEAQTVTIGSGTLVNTTTSSSPINIWYRRSLCQMVYTASEINTGGMANAGNINKLGFKIYQKPLYDIPGYTIKIKHTTVSDAGYNFGSTGWTTVKNGFTYSPTEGDFDMLIFDTPFAWNGVDNIVVQICWSQVQPTYNASGQLFVIDNVANGYAYKWTDAAGSSCGEIPNNIINYKPQIRFVFDTITVWNGSVNTDWFNPNNWSAGVPDAKMDAKIPAGTPNNPNLTGVGTCEEFILEGIFANSSTGNLEVYSHFSNSGTYNDNGGAVTFKGKINANFNNISATNIYDFNINKPSSVTVTGSAELRVTHQLTIKQGTFNTNNSVVIQSDAVRTARIDELLPTCTYTLNMHDSYGDGWNGGFVSVFVDGSFVDNYSATGSGSTESIVAVSGQTIQLVYSSGSFENENTYELVDPNNTTVFSDGPNPATGLVFTTTSNCSFSGPMPIQGEISMERYIDAGQTYWRFFSSAVQNATIADYQDDFVTAGYPGSPFPNFGWVSIYTYDETQPAGQGYTPVSSSAQTIGTAQGLYVWSGDTITGTQPFTVDLKGVPNQGDVTFSVTYTNTGSVNEDGWNLVGNPYPSTIDWDSPNWTKVNMSNAVQILNPDNQQYAAYVNGASTNGGSRYIASQQAFWVYANASSPQLIGTEKVKSPVDQPFFKTQNISPGMSIVVSNSTMSDECVMRHVDGATDVYDWEYDAYKLYGSSAYPNISLLNASGKEFSVHSFDKQFQEWDIPLKAIVYQTGFYDITFSNLQELDVPCLQLEDTYTGQSYLISEGQAINFELYDTTTTARFIIHVGRNYNTDVTSVSCSGMDDGAIELDLDVNSNVSYNLVSSNGSVNGIAVGNPLIISGLAAGTYTVEVPTLVNQCNTTSFAVVVPSPMPIGVIETITNEQLGNDGVIDLAINGGTPPYTVEWSTGQTTEDLTNVTEGVYNVTVRDANNCKWMGQYEVNTVLSVDENKLDENPKVFYDANLKQLHLTNFNEQMGKLAIIYNSNGQIVESFTVNSDVHQLNKILAKGVYILEVNGKKLKFVY